MIVPYLSVMSAMCYHKKKGNVLQQVSDYELELL